MTPTRPLVRYHGGKWRLAPWIVSHFPAHRIYVEPFGGGASVLLQKTRSTAEVYNDLDGEISNLFRVARDRGDELIRAVTLTPFSREEFELSGTVSEDPLEQARRTVARSFMGFGSASVSRQSTGFRANSDRSGSTPAHDWASYPKALALVIDRLRGVVIETRDGLRVSRSHDAADVLHYVDPPYVHSTRKIRARSHAYLHELDDAQHEELLKGLCGLEGMVAISGYRCDVYDDLLGGWKRADMKAFADGARERTESLWLSPRLQDAINADPFR